MLLRRSSLRRQALHSSLFSTLDPSSPDPAYFPDPDPPFSAVQPKSRSQKIAQQTGPESAGNRFPVRSDLPFDFQYSYSETDLSVRPLGFREPPRFSPFGPGRLERRWNGVTAPAEGKVDKDLVAKGRAAVMGEPLDESEIEGLVERYRHDDCSRQINIGRKKHL